MTLSHTYPAQITRWIDGDTVDVAVDVGFYVTANVRMRLYGCDTPERGQEGYQAAWNRVRELAPEKSTVTIVTYKHADKYGRFLAVVYPKPEGPDVGGQLLNEGLAKPYFGGTK